MKILALDVAIRGCGVAILDSATGACTSLFEETDRGQAERLIPMIDEVIHKAGISINEIDRIAVTKGPGSFTGVRIGLSAAAALGLALSIPVLGFSTLELVLEQNGAIPNALALIDTKRGDFYGQTQGSGPRIYNDADVAAWSGTRLPVDERPDLFLMARQAALVADSDFSAYETAPLYLREAETSRPKSVAA